MNMEVRQMLEKNKKARSLGLGILVFGFILCTLGFLSGVAVTAETVIRVAFFPIAIAALLFLFSKYKEKEIFSSISFAVLTLAYIAVVLFTKNIYMYAYIYLIMIYTVIYMNKKLTVGALVACNIFNIMGTVRFIIIKVGSTNELFIQAVFVIFVSVLLYSIVTLNDRHSKETMDAVTEQSEKEAVVAKQILSLSEQLAEKFEVAKQEAESMTENMDASNNAVSEIAESIKVTAESIEQQTVLTADIQARLEETDKATAEMHDAADASAEAVEAGKQAMEELSKQAELTGELNKKSQETTEELANRIHEVESITGEILNISNQTNLLALNASIEAARAGEAGRGFAVVADEIRQLSEQTKNSVNKITEITKRLVDNSVEASDNMSQSIAASAKQNEMVANTISDIDTIAEKNAILLSLMQTISKQIESVLIANTQINDSISNLSAMSQQVAASTESSSHVMSDSMSSVNSLNELLAEIYDISKEMEQLTR
ncbi:MAG: methyl-accepting chemotaxis protein [Lachnospiraceae bacterium]|nr:methyl-accepting chemotaxis protein [Lachnospiraceae bacterium]